MDLNVAKKIIAQNRETYNAIAGQFSASRQKPLWPEVLDFGKDIQPEARVLDLGCGSGRLLQLFKSDSVQYVGIDDSNELLSHA